MPRPGYAAGRFRPCPPPFARRGRKLATCSRGPRSDRLGGQLPEPHHSSDTKWALSATPAPRPRPTTLCWENSRYLTLAAPERWWSPPGGTGHVEDEGGAPGTRCRVRGHPRGSCLYPGPAQHDAHGDAAPTPSYGNPGDAGHFDRPGELRPSRPVHPHGQEDLLPLPFDGVRQHHAAHTHVQREPGALERNVDRRGARSAHVGGTRTHVGTGGLQVRRSLRHVFLSVGGRNGPLAALHRHRDRDIPQRSRSTSAPPLSSVSRTWAGTSTLSSSSTPMAPMGPINPTISYGRGTTTRRPEMGRRPYGPSR